MKFFNKAVDYFWEYEYSFGEHFLKELFPKNYKRKFSTGEGGLYNLIFYEGNIYELKFKEARKMVSDNGKTSSDPKKNYIVNELKGAFEERGIEYSINNYKTITFKLGKYIAKIEIIKKTKEPV